MELCPWESPLYLIFSSNVPTLLYYSHLVAILAALVFSMLISTKIRENLSARVFISTMALFIAWTAIDVFLWASNRPDIVLLYWSVQILFELLIYTGSIYLAYVFIRKKDPSFNAQIGFGVLLLPIVLLLPTQHLLSGIDVSFCNAIESSFVIFYTYVFEILVTFAILFITFQELQKKTDRSKEIAFFSAGLIVFLVAFSSGNIVGSLTEDWAIAQIGLFGMPIFIAFLAYTVVKFKTFNIKLIATQALVSSMWLLTFAILFIRRIENVRIVVIFTLALFTVLGYQLIQSVRREIEAKEQLARANARLKELDKQKTEFVSFATHQLRSPLASMKGYASLMLEGDMGALSNEARGAVQTIYESARTLTNVVDDYLNISRIELGTMKYDMKKIDFRDLLNEVVAEQKPNIEAKGLSITVEMNRTEPHPINVDPDKFKQVVMNVIDNSVKYTPQGSLTVSLSRANGKVRCTVSDSGVGIDPRVIPKLFQKFSRAPDAGEANIHGTGLGLFIARQIIEAHQGRIWAESPGVGKGSRFIIELPEAR